MAQSSFEELVAAYQCRFRASPDKPNETAEAIVRGLWLCAAGIAVSADRAMTIGLPPLTGEQQQGLKKLLELREQGTPLAHLTGRQQFMGLEFICSEQALIPRKETEILGAAVCDLLTREIARGDGHIKVLDLCTGSGNLACAVAKHAPSSVVFGVDLSPEAVELAGMNALQLGCCARVKLFCGDLFAPVESEAFYHTFDLVMCNPPYITTAKLATMNQEIVAHEPRMAFDGGPLGVGVLWRLLHDAPRFLKPHGWLAFEVGAGQGDAMFRRLSRNTRFDRITGLKDGAGTIRAIVGQVINTNAGNDSKGADDTVSSKKPVRDSAADTQSRSMDINLPKQEQSQKAI
jgi:release factor glutamine methyltransferase